jgi:TolA-binding protein
MLRDNLLALLLLYIRPVTAIGRILDQGRIWFAVVVAILVSVALHTSDGMNPVVRQDSHKVAKQAKEVDEEAAPQPPEQTPEKFLAETVGRFASYDSWSFFGAIGAIAVAMVPAMILMRSITGWGSFGVLMRRDYLSLLMCTLFCWSAVYLVLAIVLASVSIGSGGHASLHVVPVFAVALAFFLALTGLSVRSVWGTGAGSAIGLTLAGAAAGFAGAFVSGFVGGLPFLASPFLLFYGWRMFGSEVSSLGDGLRSRQHFQQQMEISTTNPRDADAHYQLGLIHQQRRQYSEAIARFKRTIEIDPTEAEAHFQLGRIAREQGRFEDAVGYLTTAASLNDKLSSSEVWRELGASYVGVARYEDARAALAKYTDRRSYDPEGLYWYGKALAGLGRTAEAQAAFAQCIEAVDTMPKHRRAEVRKWKGLAKTEAQK